MQDTPATTHFTPADHALIRDKIRAAHDKVIPTFSREDIHQAARHLGLLHKGVLVTKDESHTRTLIDYMIYSYRPRGFNMAELYLRSHREQLDALSRTVLEHMSQARFTLFKVMPAPDGARLPPGSTVITDVLDGHSHVLVDPAVLAMAGRQLENRATGAHLLFFDGFVMQSGNMAAAGAATLEVIETSADFRKNAGRAHKLARAYLSHFIETGASEKLLWE
jgi:hypothetical protein